jgi:MFS family permease
VQSRARLEPYRERLMTIGTVVSALAIAGTVFALHDGVPAWSVAVAWAVGGFGMGLIIASGSVLLLKLSRPEDAGSNSAALQVSDALGNITLVGTGGVLFAALGGGAAAAGADAVSAADGGGTGRPAAFAAVYLTMTASALVGTYITTRLRPRTRR